MKGIILAGGLGTRLYPLTLVTNKHLLPIHSKPMIFYPIETLVKSGIKEIMIIVSGPHAGDFIPILKNGKEFGLNHLEYAYQDNPCGGILDALMLAKDFAEDDNIAVILGDNVTDFNPIKIIKKFKSGCHIFLKKVNDPENFGVVKFDNKDKILKIIEKPKNPPSNLAVTGLYLFDNKIFDYGQKCKPSARGQLEIVDPINYYIKNKELTFSYLTGFWHDCGEFDKLLKASNFWQRKNKRK